MLLPQNLKASYCNDVFLLYNWDMHTLQAMTLKHKTDKKHFQAYVNLNLFWQKTLKLKGSNHVFFLFFEIAKIIRRQTSK